MTKVFILFLIFTLVVMADVISPTGQIKFDTQMDNQADMTLNTTGLGIGITPSTNLHVNGNTIVSDQLFVGRSSGSSKFNVNGTLGYGIQTVSSNTTLSNSTIVLVDSSSDNITLNLPYAGNVTGRQYQIKKISTSNSVWISGGGNLIDDTSPIELPESDNLASVKLISDGSQWYKIGQRDISETVAASNLVGWWKLDETSGTTASDSSGQGNDGIITNISSGNIGVNGKFKQAVDFDGINDKIIISNDGSLNIGSNNFTFSAWVNPNATNNYFIIMTKDRFDDDFEWRIRNNNYQQFFIDSNTGITGTTPIEINTFYNFVVTRKNGTVQLYVNGNEDGGPQALTGSIDNANNLIIGTRDTGEFTFNGIIDDIRIYNKALSHDEINSIYNQGQ